jgi:hypothetical protein
MIIETVLLGLMVAFISGGKIRNIESVTFRYWYLVILGFLIQELPVYINVTAEFNFICISMSYILIVIPLLLNLRIKGIYFALVGTVFNAIVIMANNGMMPVTKNAIIATGYTKTIVSGQQLDIMHFVADDSTRFKFLSDFIPLPKPYPLPQILSVGDLLLCIGLFLFIQYVFVKRPSALPEETSSQGI